MSKAPYYAVQYQKIEVNTADPFELLLILYKGATHHLNLAKKFLESKDIEQRVRSINKAIAMIGELQAALNLEEGKHIAASLDRLYAYMLKRLTLANLKRDPALLDEVTQLLSTLQSAWEQGRPYYRNHLAQPAGQEARAMVG